ncbi:hypothetical protein GNIT_3080 [Glaciecola nitratireducens FR1064]|uniref:Uncharacterized protein n=1 Tax=Glaciecola nitratireducens (strain JCM 12485 / KCTC 12276 / FR1064) TaxID=1085623 RepID=G4QIM0_GLANF|nr:hypothetical protein GNIT_3080 [Glaciecola nitratireducens FR1064]
MTKYMLLSLVLSTSPLYFSQRDTSQPETSQQQDKLTQNFKGNLL